MGTNQGRLLKRLGERVRALREERGLSRRELAEASGLSPRFLADLEAGAGNISVARLADLAQALGAEPASLLAGTESPSRAERRQIIALLGLRGAGKSSVGQALAARLDCPFFELDQLIEREAGMPRSSLFEFHGERYYRRLEREALARFLVEHKRAVLATGGGIVSEPRSVELLERHTLSVWLKARPRQHWDRVVSQGDLRPMSRRANALAELEALLTRREPLYARAQLTVDTSTLGLDQVVERVQELVAPAKV